MEIVGAPHSVPDGSLPAVRRVAGTAAYSAEAASAAKSPTRRAYSAEAVACYSAKRRSLLCEAATQGEAKSLRRLEAGAMETAKAGLDAVPLHFHC